MTNNKKTALTLSLIYLSMSISPLGVLANTKNDYHLPISHCYHWLDEQNSGFLSYKYQYGDRNNGDVAFVAGKNGAIAGPGLYCAKSPSGSYGYGDRVIRLELVDDIVMYDATTGRKYCGHDGNFYSQSVCDKKPWDIKFYTGGGKGNSAWYVIKDPQAIKMWSANSDQLISDLNVSKTLNPGGASTHFDATLKRINAERSSMGEKVYVNHNARMSIVDILDRPEILRQIPALTVIARINTVPNSDFGPKKKTKVYKEQFERALNDSFLTYSDFDDIIKKADLIEKAFKDVIANVDLTKLDKLNIPVLLLAANEYGGVSSSLAATLWKAALVGNGSLETIAKSNISSNKLLSDEFETAVRSLGNKLQNAKAHNIIALLQLFESNVKTASFGKVVSSNLSAIFSHLIESGKDLTAVYKGMKNPNIAKEAALVASISALDATGFKNLDPVVIGHMVDLLTNAQLKNMYAVKVAALPVPASKRTTYMILDEYQKGNITLPSMLTRSEYLMKLYARVIGERGQKGMTNGFRFVFSDIFHLYFSDIKAEKDQAKKDKLTQEASDFYINFIKSLSAEHFQSYAYIAMQNASFFNSGLDYDDHPMEEAYVHYKAGDANYDAFFEELTKTALEGSYLQFLIRKAEKEQNAADLLTIALDYFVNQEFDDWLDSDEFEVSQDEKKDWKNMISNKFYSGRGSFVSSDICQFSKVIYRKRKYIRDVIDPKLNKLVEDENNDLYKSKWCK